MDAAYPLTGLIAALHAAAIFAAALGFGRVLLQRIRLPDAAAVLAAIALGSGVLSHAAFLLGVLGALRVPALAVVLALGLLALALTWPAPELRALLRVVRPRPGAFQRWVLGAAALASGFALLGALLPEIEYDALWYHLSFPMRYLLAGRLVDIPCEHMSPTPQHTELLYAYALMWGDARSAKLTHLGFGLLAACWTALLAARLVGARWALLAAALFLTAPTVLWEMTTAYNELPLAFYGVGAVFLMLEWLRVGARRHLLLAAVLLGLGLATKHLAALFALPLAVAVLVPRAGGTARGSGRRFADMMLFCAVALAVAAPWYVRAWHYTGNPFFPMFWGLLDQLGVDVQRWDAAAQAGWVDAMNRYGHGREPLDLLLLPWRATWDGVAYAGSLGPAWLLFLPLLLLFLGRLNRGLSFVAAVSAAYLILWVTPYSSFQLRYLVPLLPLLAVLVAATVRWLRATFRLAGVRAAPRLLGGLVVAVLLLNLPLFFPLHDARGGWIPSTSHAAGPRAWQTAFGLYDADAYLRRRLQPYDAVRFINERLRADARIVWFAEAANFYVRPELVKDYSRCVSAGTWGTPPGDEARAHERLRSAGISHVAWDLTRSDLRAASFAVASRRFREEFATVLYDDGVVLLLELR